YDEGFRHLDCMLDRVAAVGLSNSDNSFIRRELDDSPCRSGLDAHAPTKGCLHGNRYWGYFDVDNPHSDSLASDMEATLRRSLQIHRDSKSNAVKSALAG